MSDLDTRIKEHLNIPTGRVRLLMIHQALRAQIRGMRLTAKAPTGLTIARKEFGIKAKTAAIALPIFEKALRDNGIVFGSMAPA